MRRSMPIAQEEYTPYQDEFDSSYANKLLDTSKMISAEEESQLDKATKAQADVNRMRVDSAAAKWGGVAKGVENAVGNYRQFKRDNVEERQLERQTAREDKADARTQEEFDLKKPEMEANARNAEENALLDIESKKTGNEANKATARSQNVAADTAEREQAYLNSESDDPEARIKPDGSRESRREFMARLDHAGRKAEFNQKVAEFDEWKKNAPMREKTANANLGAISASTAATRTATAGQAMANKETARTQRIAEFKAKAQAPTPEQLQVMAPALAAEVKAGRMKPEEAASVLASIADDKVRARTAVNLANSADPEWKAQFEKSHKAREEAQTYLSTIAELETATKENKANAFFNDEGALERAAALARSLGMEKEAQELLDPSFAERLKNGSAGFSSDARLAQLANKVKARMRAQMASYDAETLKDPRVQQLSARLNDPLSSGSGFDLFGGGGRTQNAAQPGPAPGTINLGGQTLNLQGDAQTGALQGPGMAPAQPLPGSRPRMKSAGK